jgi:hypothetical protein
MFLSFHHHRPERAQSILRDAFDRRIAIAIFEGSARELSVLLSYLLVPLAVLIITPSVRPLKLSQLLFTYVLPVSLSSCYGMGLSLASGPTQLRS